MKSLPNVLTPEEQRKLLGIFNLRYRNGRKNRLIVEIMLTVGLRVSEACNLKWNDIQPKIGTLTVRSGKCGKDRVLFLPPSLIDRLNQYKKENPSTSVSSFVFATRTGKPSDRSTLTKMVSTYAKKAEITEKRVYSHLLRHTALTDLYRETRDIRKVQTIAGHSSIQTTQIYTHIAPEEIRQTLTREKYGV